MSICKTPKEFCTSRAYRMRADRLCKQSCVLRFHLNPFCSPAKKSDFSNHQSSLSLIMLSNNLIKQLRRHIGRQFLRSFKSLPSLGNKIIFPSFHCSGTWPCAQLVLYRPSNLSFAAKGKDFNRLYVIQSSHGELDLSLLRAVFSSFKVKGAPNELHPSFPVKTISQSFACLGDKAVYNCVKWS